MATTQTIDATIFASTHPDIAKRISVSGVLISSVFKLFKKADVVQSFISD